MSEHNSSLRGLIAKWFGTCDAQRLRITRLHAPGPQRGCVRAEAVGAARPFAIVFFRHQAGCWRVYPPTQERAREPAPVRPARLGEGTHR